jgi:hypothetical protein
MKAKTSILCVASLLALPSLAGAALPAENTIGGSTYNMSFYQEKNLGTAGPSYCVTFTQDGSVIGYAQSGEYTDSNGVLVGSWYENGDDIILSNAEVDGQTDTAPMIGVLLSGASKFGGRWLDYVPTNGDAVIDAGGTFFATKVTSCPADNAKPPDAKNGKLASAE